jgi:hypothetical protein
MVDSVVVRMRKPTIIPQNWHWPLPFAFSTFSQWYLIALPVIRVNEMKPPCVVAPLGLALVEHAWRKSISPPNARDNVLGVNKAV